MFAPASTLKETEPAFASYIFLNNSAYLTSVPIFAFGINPFGPKNLPKCLIFPILSEVVKSLSKFTIPFYSYK